MRLSDMQKKDIIFLKTGENLGRIIDAEIELESGKFKSFLVEKKNIKSILNSSDIIIKFSQIRKIGKDVILVDRLE